MWCPRCHTEVAAEIAQNGQSLNCTSCGTEIQRIYAPSLHPDTRSARELLERWAKGDGLDVAAALPVSTPASSSSSTKPTEIVASVSPTEVSELPNAPAESRSPSPSVAETMNPAASSDIDADSTDPSTADPSSSVRRDRPERTRPERQAPKPRTTWRVDAAHTVTQPVAPPPPPVPPRRPHFATPSGDADKNPVSQKEPEKTPGLTSPVRSEVTRPVEPLKVEQVQPARLGPPQPVTKPAIERAPSPAAAGATQEVAINDNLSGPEEIVGEESTSPRPVVTRAKQRRLDPAHEALMGPHFDLQAFLSQDSRKPGRSESMWGQVLAYLGVGLITVGTTMVLWSYFGKSPQHQQYAPTGWLICTVGQMLLFLGVTTLISGGMQQTSHEVTRRVEYIGDRMLRFEQSAEQLLRGPHFNEVRDRARGKMKVGQVEEDLDSDA